MSAQPSNEAMSKAIDALRMILDNDQGESWSSGVAMSCLASIEEAGGAWGECYWHQGQPYTMAMRLCDDDGIVRPGQVVDGEHVPYPCTGGAHRFGEHIVCTSPAHLAGGR